MWNKLIAFVVTLVLAACGDVGGPAPAGTGIAPQSFANRQVLSGSIQDFSGGGTSDILWRNSNGQVAIWLMNGMAQNSNAVIATVTTDWTIAGTGDFDGDSKADIVWRNTDGRLAFWLMNGMAQKSSAVIATVSTDWTVAGTGDFDGDGKSDILWRNTNGQVAIWLMNGMAQKSSAVVATVSTDWTIVGTGDLDGDGKSDILWRNNNGQLAIWLMNGMAQTSTVVIATVSTDWTVAGTGDFDGDGKSDILWRNSNGQLAIWLMNGMVQNSSPIIATVSTDWTVAGTGDFDGDGKSDILWRNNDGRLAVWLMNGMVQKSNAVIATVTTDWQIAGRSGSMSYSIGGTVTGLIGSVVLQDNNGDNLTVAANGAFTFATKITSGSPYNVTVLTQPTGLTCLVAGGSGTATTTVSSVGVNCLSGIITGISNAATFIDRCPTNDSAYSTIRQDFELRIDGQLDSTPVTCTEPYSAMPIAQLTDELIALQTLRTAFYMSIGTEGRLPWTNLSLYAWIKSSIAGINLTSDPGIARCCRYINGKPYIEYSRQDAAQRDYVRDWPSISAKLGFYAHEMRHANPGGYFHVNGCAAFPLPTDHLACDATYDLSNLGAYGIQYWLESIWATGFLNVGIGCSSPAVAQQYVEQHAANANLFAIRFVTNVPPLVQPMLPYGGPCLSP